MRMALYAESMAHDLQIVTRRHREVEEEIARLKSRLADLEAELPDLETAARVIARLSGAEWHPTSAADEQQPPKASGGKPEGLPAVTEMIMIIMTESYRQGRRGMTPKEVMNAIVERWWPNMGRTIVSTTMWRMAQPKDGRLVKDDETSLYMLAAPRNNEADDDLLGRATSPASDVQPRAQGREAGPGGGI
jgi:hypothetical protein